MNQSNKVFGQDFGNNSCLGKPAILVQKMPYPLNSGFAIRFFFKILHDERGRKIDENNVDDFSKKNLFGGANEPFWTQKWCILIILDLLYEFFKNFAH